MCQRLRQRHLYRYTPTQITPDDLELNIIESDIGSTYYLIVHYLFPFAVAGEHILFFPLKVNNAGYIILHHVTTRSGFYNFVCFFRVPVLQITAYLRTLWTRFLSVTMQCDTAYFVFVR